MEDKKLNIAIFNDSFYPMIDGVVNVVDNYAKILSKKHNVTVFVLQAEIRILKTIFHIKLSDAKISR